MLDNNFVAEKKETVEYKPFPEDMYTVELLDVTSDQRPTYDTRNNPDDQKEYETILNFQFVLLEGKDGDEDLRGRNIFANFVPSFLYISNKNGKNKLYEIVEALQGQTVSPEQEAYGITGETINGLIGKQCRVVTVNKVNGDKTYTNIDRLLAVKEEYPALTAEEKEKATIKPKDDDKNAGESNTEPSETIGEDGMPSF